MAKTLLFVITDGGDNSSTNNSAKVKKAMEAVISNEKNAFSFVSVLFGVGSANVFAKAQQDMGVQHLAQVGTSGDEIKKMIGFISQSISKTANNMQVIF
jgi:hypothetical protein